MENKFKKNIPLLYINQMLGKNITTPIIILYYLQYGLNFGQIGIITAVAQVSSAVLQIFGGIFADLYGKKLSQIIYSILRMITMLILLFGNSFGWFVTASLFYGIALGMGLGTQHSLLFDTLKALEKEDEHKKHRGRLRFAIKTFNALAILAIPLLYTYHIKIPFLIGFIFYFVAFIVALFFEEPFIVKKTEQKVQQVFQKISSSFKEIISSYKNIYIILMESIIWSFVLVSFDYFQPLLKSIGLSVAFFGIIYFVAKFFEGLGGILVHPLSRFFSNNKFLFLIVLLVSASFIGIYSQIGFLIIAAILIISLGDGFVDVVTGDMLNQNITSQNRTTILSVSSAVQGIITAILAFGIGHLADKIGITNIFIYMFWLLVLLAGIAAIIFSPKVANQKNIT
jgi:MFS family permease